MTELDATDLATRLTTRSPAGIAEQVGQLIEEGQLPLDSRLPTVRDLAQEVGVSVGTVAQAWGLLRERGLVETRRRGGTRVIDPSTGSRPRFPGFSHVDLRFGSPHPALLPDLAEPLQQNAPQPTLSSWNRPRLSEQLRTAAQRDLPVRAETVLPTSTGSEAMWLAMRAAASPGDSIAIEHPCSPGIEEVARDLGLRPVPVETDGDGPCAEALRPISSSVKALVLAPSGAFGHHVLSPKRAEQLAAILGPGGSTIIEDDPLGPLSEDPGSSLSSLLPERTLRVRDYARAFGPDLGPCLLAGPIALIERAAAERSGGWGTLSYILQDTAAGLITSASHRRALAGVRRHYRNKHIMAVEALEQAELAVSSRPGSWSITIHSPDAAQALAHLAAQGVDLAASRHDQLRLVVSQLPEDPAVLADLAALIARATKQRA